jgi:UDP-2,3-diacylglucosamine hydrolase
MGEPLPARRRYQSKRSGNSLPSVPARRTIVVQDAHLGQTPADVQTAFHRFLETVPGAGDTLLINGDLFDFWFEYRAVTPRKPFATLAALAAARARGVTIILVGGNHDRWGGDFLERDLGIRFISGSAYLELGGRRAWVTHGDGLTEQHLGGKIIHPITRSRVTRAVFRLLHPDFAFWLASKLSGRLADSTRNAAVLDRAARAQAEFAGTVLKRERDVQLVVMGHTHRPALVEVEPGRFYLNAGAWLDGFRYAVVNGDRITLERFASG